MKRKPLSIASAAVSGIRWNYFGNLFSLTCSLTITAVLARILGPGPFGEAMIASTVYGFANLFVNGGFSQALIQQEELPPLQIRRAFTTQVALAVAFTALIVLLAPVIAGAFHTATATPVIRVMAVIISVQALGLVSAALLRRDMRFDVIQHANMSAYIVGYVIVGLPLACHGAGVWSLVAAYLTQALTNTIYLYAVVRHPVQPSLGLPDRQILRFGGAVVGSNLVNWGHSNLDNLASSRLGSGSLGLYGRACNLAYQPVTAIVTIVQPVLLSSSARVRVKPELLKRGFLSTVALVLGLVSPAYVALAFIPDTVILGLYGSKWASAVPLMVPMALAMPLWGAMAVCGPVLAGIGKPHLEFCAQAATCSLAAFAFFGASRFSLLAIAWMLFYVSAARLAAMLWVTLRALDIQLLQASEVIAGRICVAIPFGLAVFTCDRILHGRNLSSGMCLTVDVAVAFLLMGALVWGVPRVAFGRQAVSFLRENGSHLPAAYRTRIDMRKPVVLS